MVKTAVFRGPCKNKITVQIKGTIVAPSDYRAIGNSEHWILFVQVDGVSVLGGTLDAQGAGFWACRKSGQNCPVGARVSNHKTTWTYIFVVFFIFQIVFGVIP